MMDPRKLSGAAALREIADRLRNFGPGVEKASFRQVDKQEGLRIETSARKMSGRFGPRVRPGKPFVRVVEPLIDVHFDGTNLIVTTEADTHPVEIAVEGEHLTIRCERTPERVLKLPCRVKSETLTFEIVNGILQATMAPEGVA